MKIAFRADASVQIGTGHVMRCLTLAAELRRRGHTCRFVCRDLPGHLSQMIGDAGFDLTLLPAPADDFKAGADDPSHATGAKGPWKLDAAQTLAAAQDIDWLVVDHYAFDARWQTGALAPGVRLAVIDDLADRAHATDLLLDQNLGRLSKDYDDLLPQKAERLIGPKYAILRPEFAALRETALARRAERGNTVKTVLISMGGVDLDNATGAVLSVLGAQLDLRITVVMGANAPALDLIRAQGRRVQVIVNTSDMAGLMAKADLAIGAAGGASWERCALGLPTLVAVLADNQAEAAVALSTAGAAIEIGSPQSSEFPAKLVGTLKRTQVSANLKAVSQSAASVTDGRGVTRVADALEYPLVLRRATMDDADSIWHWRRALPVSHFRTQSTPCRRGHLSWFSGALSDAGRRLYVAGDPSIAHLRLDLDDKGYAAVSIILAPDARGKGLGLRLLSLLAGAGRAEGLSVLVAEVHTENTASIGLFRAGGYAEMGLIDGFYRFKLAL